ncbi:MAG TPA: alpha/beta hydrolase [Acidobacteria bacterium]|nr:alpha/beta hydrolase [Acidobacteriota bacterium]
MEPPDLRPTLPILLAVFVLSGAAFAQDRPAPLSPCKVAGADGEIAALCGTFEVWENRATRTGRKLHLKTVVLPALGPKKEPDPIVSLAGGPGEAITRFAGFSDSPLRRERDLVFVDQRGTGEPDKLDCELGRPGDLQSYIDSQFPLDAVGRCRAELEKRFDLTHYTTAWGADDLDDARAWLGYDKINLVGGSYGTRMAQVYLRRHPEHVRSVVLDGAVPMDETLPLSHAANGQRALDLVVAACAEEAACRQAFPGLRGEIEAVLAQAGREPVRVTIRHPETGQPVEIRLNRSTLADGLRWLLYTPGTAAALPVLVHEAAQGRWTPLAEASANARTGILGIIAGGLFFSVTCSEDLPFIDPATISPRTAGTFLGDDRVRSQAAACATWPHGSPETGHREPVRSDVPVLVLNGERDPVTPPDFGTRTVRGLTRALHLIIPRGGHYGNGPCPGEIIRQFLRRGSIEGLDTSCLSEIPPRPFALTVPEEGVRPI